MMPIWMLIGGFAVIAALIALVLGYVGPKDKEAAFEHAAFATTWPIMLFVLVVLTPFYALLKASELGLKFRQWKEKK